MNWKIYGDIAFYACTASTAAFSLLYLFVAPWWRTETGRNIMAVMGSVTLAFGYFAWAIALGGVPIAFYPIRALLFTGIALAVSWRIWILVKHHIIKSLKGDKDELEQVR